MCNDCRTMRGFCVTAAELFMKPAKIPSTDAFCTECRGNLNSK
jgi:hypothetical protein